MPPLLLGWGLSSSQVWYHGLTRLVEAVDREALEGLAFPGPFVSSLSKPGSVSSCRSGGRAPHLTGPVALGLPDLYALLSGLALPSPGDCNCSQDNLWSAVEVPAGPRGIVLSWEAFLLLFSTRLPTGQSTPEKSENQGHFPSDFSVPFHCIPRTAIYPLIRFMK